MSKWLQKPPLGAQIDWGHPLSKDLVVCWLINEGGGKRIHDLSLNRNHGSVTTEALWKPGRDGVALDMLEQNYIIAPDSASLRKHETFSLAAWLYSRVSTTNTRLFYKGDDADNGFVLIRQTTSNYYYIGVKIGGTGFTSHHDCTSVAMDNWIFIAATCDKGNLKFYKNGIAVVSGGTHGFGLPAAATNLYVGALDTGATKFPGLFSNVFLWNRILTSQEVWQLYANPYCFIKKSRSYWPGMFQLFRGLVTFDRVLTPAGSFWPTHNPNYGDGYVRTIRRHQPKSFCGANLYSYNKGASGKHFLRWDRIPGDELEDVVAFFDTIHGAANRFVFTDRDGGVHTARLINDDSLTWREVEPGFYEVQVDLDLS